MSRFRLLRILLTSVLAGVGCASDEPGDVDPATDSGSDGGVAAEDSGARDTPDPDDAGSPPDASTVEPTEYPKTLVVPVNLIGPGRTDYVTVLAFGADGSVTPTAAHVDLPGASPQGVAISPSADEVLIPYGLVGGNVGFLVLDVEPNAAGASERQTVALPSARTPEAITYVSADQAVLALVGPEEDVLQTLNRDSSGMWEAGPVTTVATSPTELYDLPAADSAVLFRMDVSEQNASVVPLAPNGSGAWEVQTGAADLERRPLHMAVHPSGQHAYLPIPDVRQTLTMDVAGDLFVADRQGDGTWSMRNEPIRLPRGGYSIAIAPDGSRGVVAHSNGERGEYTLQTFTLDASGTPTPVDGDDAHPKFDALLVFDMEFIGDFLVITFQEFGSGYFMLVMKESSLGAWEPVGTPYTLPGRVEDFGVLP